MWGDLENKGTRFTERGDTEQVSVERELQEGQSPRPTADHVRTSKAKINTS